MKIVLLASCMLLCVACSSEEKADPAPASPVIAPVATASFAASRTVVEANEPINFTNTSQNASRYEWNFGNGQTSTVAAPSAVYATTGSYTVTLTAYNADNKPVVTTQTIRVGKRYLKDFRVIINFQGVRRDTDGTGPDILMLFKPVAAASNYSTATYYDLISPNPITPLVLTPSSPDIELTAGDWQFGVYERNGNNGQLAMEYAYTITGPSADRDAQGQGTYTISLPANDLWWKAVMSYETR